MAYAISADRSRVDRDVLWAFLSTEAYWGRFRDRTEVEGQLDSAWRVIGAYDDDGAMAGFMRAVSDGVNTAYLADVFVLGEHRGHGLAQLMLTEMIDRGPGARFRWMLHTADAHGLYRKFGFAEPDASYLERPSTR
jgi:GNAT superfamily N-acetyltransferase